MKTEHFDKSNRNIRKQQYAFLIHSQRVSFGIARVATL